MEISKKLKFVTFILFIFSFFTLDAFADSTYIVKKGDTLYSISRKYQLTVPELRAANNLSENDVLKEGAKLVIPSADISTAAALSTKKDEIPKTAVSSATQTNSSVSSVKTTSYTVKAGDTLYGIAKKNGLKLAELLSVNNLDSKSTLKVGQKLLVPSVSGVDSAQQTKSAETKSTTKTSSTENAATATAMASGAGIKWPLANPRVKNISGKVSGVELTGLDNEAVKAIREGTVMYTGIYRGFGEVVFVQSKTGLIYSYSGLAKVSAKKGAYVVAGTEIGKAGKGGNASIKFMVFQNGMPIDPAKAPRG